MTPPNNWIFILRPAGTNSDAHPTGVIKPAGRPGRQIVERLADDRRRERERRAFIRNPVARAPDRDRAGPWIGEHGGAQHHRRVRRQASAGRVAVRRPGRSPPAAPARAGAAASGRSKTSGSIERAVSRAGRCRRSRGFRAGAAGRPRSARSRRPARARAGSAAGRSRRPRGRPTDPAARYWRAARPRSVHHRGEVGVRRSGGAADQAARRHRGAAIVVGDPSVKPSETSRGSSVSCARVRRAGAPVFGGHHEILLGPARQTGAPPRGRKLKRPPSAAASKANAARERLDRRARRHRPVDHVAIRPLAERAGVAARSTPGIRQDRRDEPSSGRRSEPPAQPVTGLPVRPVRPDVGGGREEPDRAAHPRSTDGWRRVDHPAAVDGRDRVVRRQPAAKAGSNAGQHALPQDAAAPARRPRRWRNTAGRASRLLGSGKTLGWLAPLSTAGQPSSVNQIGLLCGTQAVAAASRTPPARSWCGLLHQLHEVLDPPHPRLAKARR